MDSEGSAGWRQRLQPWWPLMRVAVSGDSMAPTLADGDWLVCRRITGASVVAGDVVVAEQPNRPGFVLVKRATERKAGGWWLSGDNVLASDDSRVFGVVDDSLVIGRVLFRYAPKPRWI